jgi:DNA repair protein RecN (Recombination protein N)
MEQLNELQQGLSRYLEGIEVEPERQLELEQRLHVLQSLKRKYGGNMEAILAFGSAAEQELASLEGREAELERLDQLLADSRSRLQSVSEVLTLARRRWIPKLSKAVQEELRSLGFRQSRFSVELSAAPNISSTGSDQIEFLFAPNPGEPPRPLRAIASSGELARVMLGLKTVLAVQDEVPVLVFDEVDANVGGETAHVVGQKMAQIAKTHQVLCITHLPQVASCANCHYLVEKEVEQGRTLSRLTRLNGEARTEEIARMLGGGKAARHHAQALLNGEIKSE